MQIFNFSGSMIAHLTNGSTQTPKPTLFLWVALRLLYHKKLSGLGTGEPGVRCRYGTGAHPSSLLSVLLHTSCVFLQFRIYSE